MVSLFMLSSYAAVQVSYHSIPVIFHYHHPYNTDWSFLPMYPQVFINDVSSIINLLMTLIVFILAYFDVFSINAGLWAFFYSWMRLNWVLTWQILSLFECSANFQYPCRTIFLKSNFFPLLYPLLLLSSLMAQIDIWFIQWYWCSNHYSQIVVELIQKLFNLPFVWQRSLFIQTDQNY